MAISTTPHSHILLVPFSAFGHTRPVSVVAARLVLEKEDLILTFFVAPPHLKQVREDIANQFPESLVSSDVKEKALKRIRVVTTYKATENDIIDMFTASFQSYPAAYETLYRGRPFTCATTGETFDAVPPPVAIVIDLFALPQLQVTRAISGTAVPIIAMLILPASSFIRTIGPSSMGGIGDFGKGMDDEAARLGISPDELAQKLFRQTDGRIIKLAGLPDMHDYELFPQELAVDTPMGSVFRGAFQFLNECDGALIASSHSYEDASLTQMKSWLQSLPRNPPLYALGPLLPPGCGRHSAGSSDLKKIQVEREIEAFLTEMQAKHGERSVVFIAFGTIFWPIVPGYIEAVIEALTDKGVPFVLCHASPYAKFPEEIANDVKASGLGLLTTWAPQQYILSHPATGWFLTHGGNGGVTESLGCGIPMICWPFAADQPTTTAHISCNLKVAFELVEIRTGPDGSQPLLRNGRAPKGTPEAVGKEFREVIDACRGEEGKELRRNAEEMKRKFEKAWEEGGEAKQALSAFLGRFV
ncbi:glycosyltransferase family 1 protein [Hebeloma cylindrosporum]|uniref:Glycosyltransferase family 1 protein n=1 Tax=Hebeloma cylindrosporum TaxID=76867 RepID=A0A0C3BQN9_HEBCY|nr:glycosyltransferase family 1 protein [Hebeloma cylindrosporum h7]